MSNVIKSSNVLSKEELLNLIVKRNGYIDEQPQDVPEEEEPKAVVEVIDDEALKLRDTIINDAQTVAVSRIQEAANECEKMFTDAQAQIEVWWLEKRTEDEKIKEEVRLSAYEQAYSEALIAAKKDIELKWKNDIDEAASIVTDAYRTREQIIQETEPYIVELSCSISETIIGDLLDSNSDLVIDMIKRLLARRREQGEITLCIAPKHLSFVQAARDELMAAIDSLAELIIIPDVSVKDYGCVIRSKFGSIDARIDTQLTEIKRELLIIAHQTVQEGRLDDDQA